MEQVSDAQSQVNTAQTSKAFPEQTWPRCVRQTLADIIFWLRMATWSRLDNRFDRRYGTRTGGVLGPRRLGIRAPAGRFGVRYQAIEPAIFRRALEPLASQTDFGRFTFVDLGCGKGRALLLARELGFKEIVGVELSPVLTGCARRNLEVAGAAGARVACQDAAEFAYPPRDLVVYLFHPFRGVVFWRAIENLCRQANGEVHLVYIAAVEEAALRARPCFVLTHRASTFVIYRHIPHPSGSV
jgi:SAM-dependent methyltransferase